MMKEKGPEEDLTADYKHLATISSSRGADAVAMRRIHARAGTATRIVRPAGGSANGGKFLFFKVGRGLRPRPL